MLGSINSDNEDGMDSLINDSNTEFVSYEPLVSGPPNSNSEHSVLALEVSMWKTQCGKHT